MTSLSDKHLSDLLTFKLYYSFNEKGFDLGGHDSPRNVVSTTPLLDAAAEYVAFLGSFYAWSLPNPFQPLVTEFVEPLRSIATSAPLQIISEILHQWFGFLNQSVPIPGSTEEYVNSWVADYCLSNPAHIQLQAVVNTSFMRTWGFQASAVSQTQGVQNSKNSRSKGSATLGPCQTRSNL